MSLFRLFLVFIINSYRFLLSGSRIFLEWEIILINGININICLLFDWLTFFFLSVVSLISCFIILYSIYYIEGEFNNSRFILVLFSFISSIYFLIIRPNLIRIMLGWDGLGLSSYALVIFYQNESSANSGMITVLRNRVGDATILLSIGWILYKGRWRFYFFNNLDYLIIFFIILRSFTKRAQIPFSAWLPAAMAAPTPVSSLVHSSTLVTAGVFLVIRFSGLVYSNNLEILCLIFGIITTLISGWVANFERDIKKVVALSTLSQLGIIFIAIGLGQRIIAFFHLIAHALFKSTLFICTGFVIHNIHGSQDIRLRGYINFSSPVIRVAFSCTNLSLCGFPFLAGYFSKDLILEYFFRGFNGLFILLVGVLSVGLTVSYRVRFLYNNCNNKRKINRLLVSCDSNRVLFFSLVFLFIFRIVGGYFFSWLVFLKSGVFIISLFEKFYIFSICIVVSIFFIYYLNKSWQVNSSILSFFSLMGFLPLLSSYPLRLFFLKSGLYRSKTIDKGWYEFRGPVGIQLFLSNIRFKIQKTQTLILIGFIFFSFLIFFFFLLNFYLESS